MRNKITKIISKISLSILAMLLAVSSISATAVARSALEQIRRRFKRRLTYFVQIWAAR